MKVEVILQISFKRHNRANAFKELAKSGFISDSIESIEKLEAEGFFKEEGDEAREEMDKKPFDLKKYLEQINPSYLINDALDIETSAELLPNCCIKFIANVQELMFEDYTKMNNKQIINEIKAYLTDNSLEDGTYECEDSYWIIYTNEFEGKKYEYGLLDYRSNHISVRFIS